MRQRQAAFMEQTKPKEVAVIVAHPDDETLWAGGTILSQPGWRCFIVTLCRASDPDRAPKFFRALQALGAEGTMGDLDDGPDQIPLAEREVQDAILERLPLRQYDIIVTHSPQGEYTRHRRHEEIGKAMIALWHAGKLSAAELWLFAYEDARKRYLPQPIKTAGLYVSLPESIWQKKYSIITGIYGFSATSFEAQTTPRTEAFWRFTDPMAAHEWLANKVFNHESSDPV